MGKYNSKLQSEELDFLIEALLTLKTKEEFCRFFEDIFTVYEIKAIEQRLQVAKMLMEKRTYLDISSTTGASTATISRVNRSLNYGSEGYKIVFDRLNWK